MQSERTMFKDHRHGLQAESQLKILLAHGTDPGHCSITALWQTEPGINGILVRWAPICSIDFIFNSNTSAKIFIRTDYNHTLSVQVMGNSAGILESCPFDPPKPVCDTFQLCEVNLILTPTIPNVLNSQYKPVVLKWLHLDSNSDLSIDWVQTY